MSRGLTPFELMKREQAKRERWRKIEEECEKDRNESHSEWFARNYPERVKAIKIIFLFLVLALIGVSIWKMF